MKELELAKFQSPLQRWIYSHLQSMYENYRDRYIYPVCDANGEIIMYEVYSEKCTKCIEKWSVVKE